MFNRISIISAAAVFLGLSVFVANAQVSVEERLAPERPAAVIAHRSAQMGGHPENSLAWIQFAIGRGIDIAHVNPQLTADDQYVLMHDNTLNRTTDVEQVFPNGPPDGPTREQRGGKDYVRDYTLDQIKQLQILGTGDGTNHAVPTLREAIDLVDGQLLMMLGLKSYEVDSLSAALKGQDDRNLLLFDLYYSGTDQSKLREAASATGLDAVVALYQSRNYLADLELIADQLGPRIKMISVDSSKVTPEFLARMAELDLRLVISGWKGAEDLALVNEADPGPWIAAFKTGFAAMTDQPDLVLKLLGR